MKQDCHHDYPQNYIIQFNYSHKLVDVLHLFLCIVKYMFHICCLWMIIIVWKANTLILFNLTHKIDHLIVKISALNLAPFQFVVLSQSIS